VVFFPFAARLVVVIEALAVFVVFCIPPVVNVTLLDLLFMLKDIALPILIFLTLNGLRFFNGFLTVILASIGVLRLGG
jgi:hypothetical protein